MRRRNGRLVMAALLCASMIFGLGGCKKEPKPNPEPVSGGTLDQTDPDAPKVIESGEITEFYAKFYTADRWTAEERHDFQFAVKPGDDGALTAYEELSGISCPADETLLASLQQVIEENGLVEKNGLNRITAGLAPECQPCVLRVDYASGERLFFTEDNNPFADWSREMYTVFADWFKAQGDGSLYPEEESSAVVSLAVECTDGEESVRYSPVRMSGESGDPLLGRSSDGAWEGIPFPEDYSERVTEILARYDLSVPYAFSRSDHDDGYYGFGGLGPDDGEADAEDRAVSLHIKYESGSRINIDTRKPSEIEALRPLLTELFAYHDALFAADS